MSTRDSCRHISTSVQRWRPKGLRASEFSYWFGPTCMICPLAPSSEPEDPTVSTWTPTRFHMDPDTWTPLYPHGPLYGSTWTPPYPHRPLHGSTRTPIRVHMNPSISTKTSIRVHMDRVRKPLDFMDCTTHRSRRILLSTSTGGASTSTPHLHSRSGCPSPTFLHDNSTPPWPLTDIQPLNRSRDSYNTNTIIRGFTQ